MALMDWLFMSDWIKVKLQKLPITLHETGTSTFIPKSAGDQNPSLFKGSSSSECFRAHLKGPDDRYLMGLGYRRNTAGLDNWSAAINHGQRAPQSQTLTLFIGYSPTHTNTHTGMHKQACEQHISTHTHTSKMTNRLFS